MKRLKAALAAACISAVAAPIPSAFGEANPIASCAGQGASTFAPQLGAVFGQVVAGQAQTSQPLGQTTSAVAQTNTGCPGL